MPKLLQDIQETLYGRGELEVLRDDGMRSADQDAFRAKLAKLHAQIAADNGVEVTEVKSLSPYLVLSDAAEHLLGELGQLREEALKNRDPQWGTTGNPFWDCPVELPLPRWFPLSPAPTQKHSLSG